MEARKTYLLITFCTALFFSTWSMYTGVYRVAAGLSPLQLVLLGTVLEASVFFAEVPTGIVADTYSRKLSIIIGVFVIGLGFILEGLLPWVVTIFAAQALWGVGHTFTSGAQDAWLAGEIGASSLGSTLLKGSQFGRVGSLLGMGVAVAIGLLTNIRFSLITGGAGMLVLALSLIWLMPETGFAPTDSEDRDSWRQMRFTFQQGLDVVRNNRILTLMFVATLITGLSSEGLDRFWEAHLLTNFTFPALMADTGQTTIADLTGGSVTDFGPNITIWFFIINLSASLLSLLITEIVRRRVDVDNDPAALRYLIIANGIIICGVLLFGLANGIATAIAAWLVLGSFRGTIYPFVSALLNRQIRQEVRATVLSMWGQADAVGQMFSGPLMGIIATVGSFRIAFVAVAVLLAPIFLIYRRVLRTIS
ncbi:MAG: hypothetical protein AB8G95_27670 [Anaerolineae bacterium]